MCSSNKTEYESYNRSNTDSQPFLSPQLGSQGLVTSATKVLLVIISKEGKQVNLIKQRNKKAKSGQFKEFIVHTFERFPKKKVSRIQMCLIT